MTQHVRFLAWSHLMLACQCDPEPSSSPEFNQVKLPRPCVAPHPSCGAAASGSSAVVVDTWVEAVGCTQDFNFAAAAHPYALHSVLLKLPLVHSSKYRARVCCILLSLGSPPPPHYNPQHTPESVVWLHLMLSLKSPSNPPPHPPFAPPPSATPPFPPP